MKKTEEEGSRILNFRKTFVKYGRISGNYSDKNDSMTSAGAPQNGKVRRIT